MFVNLSVIGLGGREVTGYELNGLQLLSDSLKLIAMAT